MARLAFQTLCLSAIACSGLCDGIADATILHQGFLQRSKPNQPSNDVKPNKTMISRTRPVIRQAIENVFKRATTKVNLPIPAVFRWELTGKITNWAMQRYTKPKTPAALDLVDNVIDLASSVLGNDMTSLSDEELIAKLYDWARIQQIALHYADQKGAPPAVTKLINSAGAALQGQHTIDPSKLSNMIIDIANETSGAPLADLMAYAQAIGKKEAVLDQAKVFDMIVPLVTQLGAPPAVSDLIHTSAEMIRSHAKYDEKAEVQRALQALALASTQLSMPTALSELLNHLKEVQVAEKPDAALIARFYTIGAKLSEQLEAPKSVTELIRYVGEQGAKSQLPEASKLLQFLVSASKEVGEPPVVAELLEYLGPVLLNQTHFDQKRNLELVGELAQQLEAPDAVLKFEKNVAALMQKGTPPDTAKLFKLTIQMLRKLGMPALASVLNDVAGPVITKGTQPSPVALAAALPNLMKVMPDIEAGQSIFKGMRTKLLSPLLPVYERAVVKLVGQMPETFTKHTFERALSKLRPPVPVESS